MSSSKVLALSLLLACGTQAQPQEASIEGNGDQILMKVPGATLTFSTSEGTEPSNGAGWKTSYVASDLLTEAVTAVVEARSQGMVTPDLLDDAMMAYSTNEELEFAKNAQKLMVTSISVTACNETLSQKVCISGDAQHEAVFYGFGFMLETDGLYSCAVVADGVETFSPATVTEGTAGRLMATCTLPPANHETEADFTAAVYLVEGNLRVPYAYSNPLIQYFNDGPIINGFDDEYAFVTGEDSKLSPLDGKTVVVGLDYTDFYDDDATLTVKVVAVSSDKIESMTLDTTTKMLSIRFIKSWMDTFVQRTDGDDDGAIYDNVTISVTVTDSHSEVENKDITFKVSHAIVSWNSDGNSDLLSNKARNAILKRLGLKASAQFELCYSVATHGWSQTTFHTACDNKGPLLLLMRAANSDRTFGGYYMENLQSTCTYKHVGKPGDVEEGASATDRSWMFNVLDNAPDDVNFAYQIRDPPSTYAYYQCSSYFLVFGGGFDFYCGATSCYCNVGFSYRTKGDVSAGSTWCTGTQYTYPASGTGFDYYEVYALESE